MGLWQQGLPLNIILNSEGKEYRYAISEGFYFEIRHQIGLIFPEGHPGVVYCKSVNHSFSPNSNGKQPRYALSDSFCFERCHQIELTLSIMLLMFIHP